MQMEMEEGGKLFFDLFVAMCNHMVFSPCLTLSCVLVLVANFGLLFRMIFRVRLNRLFELLCYFLSW